SERVGDAGARQLADLFGGNRFDDLIGAALDHGGVLQAARVTAHVDGLQLLRLLLFLVLLLVRRVLVGRRRLVLLLRLILRTLGRRAGGESDVGAGGKA